MALKKIHDHCVFLENSTNRCTIYEHRPVTCRDHPFNLTFSAAGALEKISLSRIVKCPHAWDGKIQRRELRRVNDWNERQQEAYVVKIKAWHQIKNGRKSATEFLRFLGFRAVSQRKGGSPSCPCSPCVARRRPKRLGRLTGWDLHYAAAFRRVSHAR